MDEAYCVVDDVPCVWQLLIVQSGKCVVAGAGGLQGTVEMGLACW